MDAILDFSQPLDVTLFERVVACLSGSVTDVQQAQAVLTKFQEHPDSWMRVDTILQQSQCATSKFIALSVLEAVITSKWNALPEEQRKGIRGFITHLVVSVSSDPVVYRQSKSFVGKLNTTLVKIVKREWPGRWPTFVEELVGSSEASDTLMENNVAVLKILSEEIFDFTDVTMKRRWLTAKKHALNKDFALIHNLCSHVLHQKNDVALILETLECMERFLTWIPEPYLFETDLVELFCTKFLPVKVSRTRAMRCLIETVSLESVAAEYASQQSQQLRFIFSTVMTHLINILPTTTQHESEVPQQYENGDGDDQEFVDLMCIFLTSLFRNHFSAIEGLREAVSSAHRYLIGFTYIDNKEMFKTCVDYWWWLGQSIITREAPPVRKAMLTPTLTDVRLVMISKMAKPEEVIIVEDDSGELCQVYMNDVESLQLYASMRETLIFLCNIDRFDTEKIMTHKMGRQLDQSEYSWNNLNTLCWAVGSISGAMSAEEEKSLLVSILKDLLTLCERVKGKENKAVVASNIMYVVGQYPRFLQAHDRFFRTVISKLVEFMHEPFPGVMDMAVDTFLKIFAQCGACASLQQYPGTKSFTEEIIDQIVTTTSDLNFNQIHIFYEGMGHAIAGAPVQQQGPMLLALMEECNLRWAKSIEMARTSFNEVQQNDECKMLIHVLTCNHRVAASCGPAFIYQFEKIFWDCQHFYTAFSNAINAEVAQKGAVVTQYQHVKFWRSVKRSILKVIENFVKNTNQEEFVAVQCVPPLFDSILTDYSSSVGPAKDATVLSVVTAVIHKMTGALAGSVPSILDAVFQSTIDMISDNDADHPEHRIELFRLLREINLHCFSSFVDYVQSHPEVLRGMLWASKHTERNVMNTSLELLSDFLVNVSSSNFATPFYENCFFPILNDIMVALLDTLHQSGFKFHVKILAHLFNVSVLNANSSSFGVERLQEFLFQSLSQLPSLSETQIRQFSNSAMQYASQPAEFKELLVDFMTEVRVWGAELDDDEVRKQELAAAVPGMATPTPGYVPSFDRLAVSNSGF